MSCCFKGNFLPKLLLKMIQVMAGFTLYLLVSFADNLCKQFELRCLTLIFFYLDLRPNC